MTKTSVHNGQDIIDSRDVIARTKDLQDRKGSEPEDWTEEDEEELGALVALTEEASGSANWEYGETFIRDSYFETYARELAENIGALRNCDRWPATCIDWEWAAEELRQNYMSVDFEGVEYWIRA